MAPLWKCVGVLERGRSNTYLVVERNRLTGTYRTRQQALHDE